MKVEVAGDSPWPYGAPSSLEPPSAPLTFEGLVQRLARFSRDGLLDIGARVLWAPWQKGAPPAWDDLGFHVTEAYGPDVVGLAMMFCPQSGLDATDLDFRLLCWELYSLGSFADWDSAEADAERQRIKERWSALLGATGFGKLIPGEIAQHVRGIWMAGRLRAATHQMATSVSDDVLRVALLHEAMEQVARDPHRLRQLRDAYFRNDVFRLLGDALVLLGEVKVNKELATKCPGRFDVFAEDLHQLEVIDFAQLGGLACRPGSEFHAIGEELRALQPHERKLHPLARPLSSKPGIVLDEHTDRRAYFYPSPRRLIRSFRRVFVDDFIEFLTQEPRLEPSSLLGAGLHRHLGEVLNGLALVIDDEDCPVPGKKPDALWCGERFGVVIEAKVRLTPRTDPECVSPDSLLEAWRRAWEAVEQADGFLNDPAARAWVTSKTGRSPSEWALAILVDERGIAERSQFRHATSRWRLLSGTKLAGLALLSFEGLEAAVRTQTPDSLGAQIARDWKDSGADALAQPPEEPSLPRVADLPYLQRASRLLVR
jgi:hypothetical protein